MSELPTAEELDPVILFDRPPSALEPGFDSHARWHGAKQSTD